MVNCYNFALIWFLLFIWGTVLFRAQRKATNGCKKFKFWHSWERSLYEIQEYAFKENNLTRTGRLEMMSVLADSNNAVFPMLKSATHLHPPKKLQRQERTVKPVRTQHQSVHARVTHDAYGLRCTLCTVLFECTHYVPTVHFYFPPR